MFMKLSIVYCIKCTWHSFKATEWRHWLFHSPRVHFMPTVLWKRLIFSFYSKRSQQAWMPSQSDFLQLWSLMTLLTRSAAKLNWTAAPHSLPARVQPSLPWRHVSCSSSSLYKCVKKNRSLWWKCSFFRVWVIFFLRTFCFLYWYSKEGTVTL